ncbi:CLIP domain-containing serine protease B14-like [Anopheles stephensi]|uniref:CLIP domain-containing serine protease B14-like n=1 Tax=Anopheles stephensi TaxID=30069 RepID=UPI0016589DBA|nr:CLIP domain-containing serine protease B14-like [Anopheles stephensi]
MHCLWILLCGVLCFLTAVRCSDIGQEAQPCTTPKGIAGQCVRVRDCGYVLDLLRKDNFFYNDTEYLKRLQCGTLPDGRALVCCPRFVNEPQCGPFALGVRIFGGNDTKIGEYPWMALLRFQTRNRKIQANCAGSLISKRFVLTAAHCYTMAKKKGWAIHSVRVAEWNYMNHRGNKDCKQLPGYGVPICRKDYDVARFVVHPDYRVNYAVHVNDIALIELTADVEYNVFVTPICLPVNATILPPGGPGTEYTAAGWGSTDQDSGMSYLLKQINLREFDMNRCKKLFQVPNDDGVGVGHICAGGVRGEDTCHGDSGGPLMESADGVWYLTGITSFGWPRCGMEGVPGVYTNVSHYLDWIAQETYRGILV